MNPLMILSKGKIVPLMFFFGVKKHMKVDMPLNKEIKTKSSASM